MNLPNTLTLIRIAMAPLLLFVMLMTFPYQPFFCLGIFVLAAATDGLDGCIARKHNQVTDFGKFIDPLADKLLVCAALIGLMAGQKMAPWPVFIILSREFMITGFRLVCASKQCVLAADVSGKIKTVLQIVAIAWRIFDELVTVSVGGVLASDILLFLAVAMTLYSGMEYLWKNKHLIVME